MFKYLFDYDPNHKFTWQENIILGLLVVGMVFLGSISGINF